MFWERSNFKSNERRQAHDLMNQKQKKTGNYIKRSKEVKLKLNISEGTYEKTLREMKTKKKR